LRTVVSNELVTRDSKPVSRAQHREHV